MDLLLGNHAAQQRYISLLIPETVNGNELDVGYSNKRRIKAHDSVVLLGVMDLVSLTYSRTNAEALINSIIFPRRVGAHRPTTALEMHVVPIKNTAMHLLI